MYMELTPEDTVKDLQRLLIDSIPGFEFPRKDLYSYEISLEQVLEEDILNEDFVIGIADTDLDEDSKVIVDRSHFSVDLSSEEVNILALLMKQGWVQRQVASIENTRMKYSGSDFKFTSQANHLSKLMNLLSECQRESFHMQRLYKRRKLENGIYKSNWSILLEDSALDN